MRVFPGVLASIAGLVLFIVVATAVSHLDWMTAWDIQALQWLHSGTSPFGIELFSTVSHFGSPLFLAFLGAVVAFILIGKRQWTILAGWCLALIGGEILETLLKLSIRRPRPEFSAPFLSHFTYSLPSGHAMTSLIAYGMLSHVLITVWEPGRAARTGIIATAMLLIIVIGFSRVYLGVHYISDVVAGFAAGTAWMCLCISLTNSRRNRSHAGPERT